MPQLEKNFKEQYVTVIDNQSKKRYVHQGSHSANTTEYTTTL